MGVLSRKRRGSLPWALALAAAHAALFALAFPPFDLWFLAFLAPAPLAWLAINAASTRRALLATFIAQLLMWLWLMRWIIPVTAVGWPFLAGYMSIWPALVVWITRRAAHNQATGRWPMIILLPVIWTAVEFFRGDLLFHGYPWYLLGHPLIAWPVFAQSADLFGTYFLGFLAAMPSGLLIDLMRAKCQPLAASRSSLQISNLKSQISVLVACFALNIAYGIWRMSQTVPLSPGPRILAIQTNLPQDNKVGWSAEDQARDVPQFIELTRRAFEQADPKPDLIVWPETMVPGMGFEPQTLRDLFAFPNAGPYTRWPLAVMALSRELDTPFLVGSEAWVETSIVPDDADPNLRKLARRYTYNSAFLIVGGGDPPYQRYDKSFLTPFGETMPYISAWPWLEKQFLSLGVGADMSFNLDSNPDINLLELRPKTSSLQASKPLLLATPICFEDTVARLARRMAYRDGSKQADIFVNISNDGWFNSSQADRQLHAQIARLRCIENRVPMVRCVNTGMSVSIDSAGRLVAAAGGPGYGVAWKSDWVLADVKLDSRSTLYGRVGEIWSWMCLIFTAMVTGWTLATRQSGRVQ